MPLRPQRHPLLKPNPHAAPSDARGCRESFNVFRTRGFLRAMATNVVPLRRKEERLEGRLDDELMLLCSAGTREAFEELVRRHARRVLAFCAKHVGHRSLGEEMAQEIWLSVWDHRAGYRPEGKFLGWLFTLARNRVRNARRDRANCSMLAPTKDSPAEAPDLTPSEVDRLLIADGRSAPPAPRSRDRAESSRGYRRAYRLLFEVPGFDDRARDPGGGPRRTCRVRRRGVRPASDGPARQAA